MGAAGVSAAYYPLPLSLSAGHVQHSCHIPIFSLNFHLFLRQTLISDNWAVKSFQRNHYRTFRSWYISAWNEACLRHTHCISEEDLLLFFISKPSPGSCTRARWKPVCSPFSSTLHHFFFLLALEGYGFWVFDLVGAHWISFSFVLPLEALPSTSRVYILHSGENSTCFLVFSAQLHDLHSVMILNCDC